MVVLLVAALVILGPERLPGAISWTFKALRQARDYVTGATTQLRDELGPEFDDLREPLTELNKLRKMNPRSVITRHVLDGDDFLFTGESKQSGPKQSDSKQSGPKQPGSKQSGSKQAGSNRSNGASANGKAAAGAVGRTGPAVSDTAALGANETPPVDPDAT